MQQKTLASLKIGEKGVVVGFTDELLSLKLLEMGVLPGLEFTISQLAPFGDPIAIKLSDYLLALRKDEAETVLII
ncbi:MAG: FeoA family protein [Bacteroidota bacterium]